MGSKDRFPESEKAAMNQARAKVYKRVPGNRIRLYTLTGMIM